MAIIEKGDNFSSLYKLFDKNNENIKGILNSSVYGQAEILLTKQNGIVYILQNIIRGHTPPNKYNFSFGWVVIENVDINGFFKKTSSSYMALFDSDGCSENDVNIMFFKSYEDNNRDRIR